MTRENNLDRAKFLAVRDGGLTEEEADRMIEDNQDLFEPEYDCELCEDTGEVDVLETVWQGEPHQAPTGTRKCICVLGDGDYED